MIYISQRYWTVKYNGGKNIKEMEIISIDQDIVAMKISWSRW